MTNIRFVTGLMVFCVVCMIAVSSPHAQHRGKPIILPPDAEINSADDYAPPVFVGREIVAMNSDDQEKPAQNPVPPMERDSREHGYKSRLMIMWNLVDYLNLDEKTAADFFPMFNEYNQKRDKLTDTHRKLVEQILDNIDKDSYSVSELKNLVQKLDDNEEYIRKERAAFHQRASKILDDRQFIKLVIFNDKLKRDLFKRFSAERLGTNISDTPDARSSESRRESPIQNIDKKRLEELQKMLEQQKKDVERQQKEIEKLLKEK